MIRKLAIATAGAACLVGAAAMPAAAHGDPGAAVVNGDVVDVDKVRIHHLVRDVTALGAHDVTFAPSLYL